MKNNELTSYIFYCTLGLLVLICTLVIIVGIKLITNSQININNVVTQMFGLILIFIGFVTIPMISKILNIKNKEIKNEKRD